MVFGFMNNYISFSEEIKSMFFNMIRRNPALLVKKSFDIFAESDSPSLPLFLQIEPTTKCNLNCKMCYVKKTGRNMDFDLFKKIVEETKDIANMHLQGLGEPLMNSEIFRMLEYAKKKNIDTSITSNGLLLNENAIKRLKSVGIKFIYLSIDASSKELYEKIRRGGNFDILEKNLNGARGNINRIMSIVMEDNIDDIENMVDFCAKFDVPMLYLHYENQTSDVSKDIRNAVNRTEAKAKRSGIKFRSLVPLNPKKRLCKWPWIGSYITVDGDVLPCCNWPWFSKSTFGNIHEDDFKTIWNSKNYRNFRKAMKNGIPEVCKKCHRCKVSVL